MSEEEGTSVKTQMLRPAEGLLLVLVCLSFCLCVGPRTTSSVVPGATHHVFRGRVYP